MRFKIRSISVGVLTLNALERVPVVDLAPLVGRDKINLKVKGNLKLTVKNSRTHSLMMMIIVNKNELN